MDMQQTAQELQKFSDAHGMNVDVSTIIDNMDAGDFVALNNAMDNNDNRTISQLLQKYKAHMSESFKYFNSTSAIKHIKESTELKIKIDAMSVPELSECYKQFSTYGDVSQFSTQELKALVYEDMTSQLKTNQIAKMNTTQQQQKMNPQTQAKTKQAELTKNANHMQVTVPGEQSGTDAVEPVVGVDPGENPQQSLVITKSSNKPNELNVFSINDVNPVTQQGGKIASQAGVTEEYNVGDINSDVMAPQQEMDSEMNPPSVLGNDTKPGMGEMIHAIKSIEKGEDTSGEESPMGNSAQHKNDEIIDQIMDFCARMRGM